MQRNGVGPDGCCLVPVQNLLDDPMRKIVPDVTERLGLLRKLVEATFIIL